MSQGHCPVGLVLNPESSRRHSDELIEISRLPKECIFDGARIHQQEIMGAMASLKPNLGLSILYDQIIGPELIDLFPDGIINIHPGLLPYNRGNYPNVWSIIDGTPSGVTLHYIDEGLDTGDIIAQREVDVLPVDTGKSLYHKLENAMLELLMDQLPDVVLRRNTRSIQDHSVATHHRRGDVRNIDCIDLDSQVRAGDLIDLLRARTFPPYSAAYFEHEGRKVNVRIKLSYMDEEQS